MRVRVGVLGIGGWYRRAEGMGPVVPTMPCHLPTADGVLGA